MFEVTWTWIDGSYDSFTVETAKQAEAMSIQLYRNENIVSVTWGEI